MEAVFKVSDGTHAVGGKVCWITKHESKHKGERRAVFGVRRCQTEYFIPTSKERSFTKIGKLSDIADYVSDQIFQKGATGRQKVNGNVQLTDSHLFPRLGVSMEVNFLDIHEAINLKFCLDHAFKILLSNQMEQL